MKLKKKLKNEKSFSFNLDRVQPFERGDFKNSIHKTYKPVYIEQKLVIKPESAFIFFFPQKQKSLSKINFQLNIQKIEKNKNSFFEVGYVYTEDGKQKVYKQKQKAINVFSLPVSLKKKSNCRRYVNRKFFERKFSF